MAINKKFAKLRRDPGKFIKDSRLFKLINAGAIAPVDRNDQKPQEQQNNNNPVVAAKNQTSKTKITGTSQSTTNSSKTKFSEVRVIGEFTVENSVIKSEILNKAIVSKNSLASLVLIEPVVGKLIKHKYASLFMRDKEFVGFRDRYQYFAFVDPKEHDISLIKTFEDQFWRNNSFANFRNVFCLNPKNKIPMAIRLTNPFLRLIVILTEDYETPEFISEHIDEIDILVAPTEMGDLGSSFRRKILYQEWEAVESIIKEIVIDNSNKEMDMLVHAIGEQNYFDDIDHLNSSNCDCVIKMKSHYEMIYTSFADDIGNITENVESILVRESSYHRYRTLIESGDTYNLIKYSTHDGAKYEII